MEDAKKKSLQVWECKIRMGVIEGVYSAMLAASRAYEQVRNSVGYPKLNVKIVGSHAGISIGEDGATHQCNEDLALMRTIPGMIVLNPSDHYEMKADDIYGYSGPATDLLDKFGLNAAHIVETAKFLMNRTRKEAKP